MIVRRALLAGRNMGAEHAGLLAAALADDAVALDTLLSRCEVEIPASAFSFVRSRVTGWLRSVRERGDVNDSKIGREHFEAVVRSNVRDAEIRRWIAEDRFDEVYRLVQRELGGMVRARVPPQSWEDVMQQAWLEALRSYDPERGALLPLLRVIVRKLALQYWTRSDVPMEDIEEPAVDPPPPPPPACFEAALSIVAQDEPHKAVVFVLSKVIGMTPLEIDRSFGRTPLGSLMDIVEDRYFERRWNSAGARQCFRKLRDNLPFPRSETTLESYYTRDPQKNISAWTNDVWDNLRRAFVRMQARFLTLVFSLSFDPHKILTYAYLGLLCWLPRDLWSSSHAPLYTLRHDFPGHYPPEELDEEKLAACLAPLDRQLDRPRLSPAGRASLAERAGEQMAAALSAWRSEVNRAVCRKAGEEGLYAIAYINGAVERKGARAHRKAASR